MPELPYPDDLVTLSEACDLLPRRRGRKVSTRSLARRIHEGHLEGWRLGSTWYVSRAQVLGLVKLIRTSRDLTSRRQREAEIQAAWREVRGGGR